MPRKLWIALGAVCAIVSGWCPRAVAETPPTVHGNAVGFRSFWVIDPARTYRTAFDDGQTYGASKSPRPVLINVWYPARSDGPRMKHAEYLEIDTTDPVIRPLAHKLMEYERRVIEGEWIPRDQEETSAAVSGAIDRALARDTRSVRGAEPADGPFPVVIYHSGAGSSIEDNALLCERLASEGFVVIGSAYQLADGSSFNIDVENAGREIEFLLRAAKEIPGADLSRVGGVGHSAGAQALLIYAAHPGIAIDAIVSLDTTQDYRTMRDPRWPLLVTAVEKGREVYATPTMFVAGPSAMFALGDTLKRTERVYLTIPGLSHNQYISQGEVAAAVVAAANLDETGALAARAREIETTGERMRSVIVRYLKAKLCGDQRAWSELESLCDADRAAGPCIEVVESGPPLALHVGPPTPRSVHLAFAAQGADGAIAELARAESLDPSVFPDAFAFQLLLDLAAAGREDEVSPLFAYFLSRGIDARPFLVSQAEMFASIKRYPEFVDGCVRLGRIVGGEDRATADMVAKYGSTTTEAP